MGIAGVDSLLQTIGEDCAFQYFALVEVGRVCGVVVSRIILDSLSLPKATRSPCVVSWVVGPFWEDSVYQ